jgi:hypothetical protein
LSHQGNTHTWKNLVDVCILCIQKAHSASSMTLLDIIVILPPCKFDQIPFQYEGDKYQILKKPPQRNMFTFRQDAPSII